MTVFSEKRLARFDGTDELKPLYLAVRRVAYVAPTLCAADPCQD